MSTLHVSEKINQEMLPQSLALESTSADKPEVGTKRDVEAGSCDRVAGVQHDRGETGNRVTDLSQRHPVGAASATPDGPVRDAVPADAVPATAPRVFVLDQHGRPLMPRHPARTRKLLKSGRARVHRSAPFVIRLVDRTTADSVVTGVEVKIDPGSKFTGVAVTTATPAGMVGLVSFEVQHRGRLISKKLEQRSNYRRGRRSRNLRYRPPRPNNRTKHKGWLAPSLRHRVGTTTAMVARLRQWAPVTGAAQELVRFDMAKMENPEITGAEYQRGTLAGYEACEYLLAKWDRTCAYCEATSTQINLDHIHPRAAGGSNRVPNLALACIPCNQNKGSQDVATWLVATRGERAARPIIDRVLAQSKAPLRDAAAVNATRWELYRALCGTGLPVTTGSGGKTKWNRSRFCVPKTCSLDAICIGDIAGVVSYPDRAIVAKATGRGTYARTKPDSSGFPRLRLPRAKTAHGFQAGDLVRANVPAGKYASIHVDRVAVRASGSFNITTTAGTVQGIPRRTAPSSSEPMAGDGLANQKESSMQHEASIRQGGVATLLLPALKDRVPVAGQF